MIRSCDKERSGAVALNTPEGNPVSQISAAPFCEVVYEQMDWIENYNFRFKGCMRRTETQAAMLFFLDEPQILVGNGVLKSGEGQYIPYRNSDLDEDAPKRNVLSFGFPYSDYQKRNAIIRNLTDSDMSEMGTVRENPIIGPIPTKQEIETELDEILAAM